MAFKYATQVRSYGPSGSTYVALFETVSPPLKLSIHLKLGAGWLLVLHVRVNPAWQAFDGEIAVPLGQSEIAANVTEVLPTN